ncbi:tetrapyrrole biosynthesis, uroporphyrinogen III synthase [Pholiota conissans]|uniref:Tetrapyrrole biosynthesis, uroporphyrinogen III synthase n=1 Tax=Pholiota conissans TaxID=109636 RepID=A0A9P5YZU4_9AGAR|nr:tetrapyrrole biosynthesis, uroporphyrinogen III synthase [Pholiota conissans]
MRNILLLRELSESAPDRYELAFSEAGYNPISLPVLETVLTNLSTFRDILLQGPRLQDISGVIVTSKRSCEAFKEALQLVQDEGDEKTLGWDAIPFYVVGKTTETALKGVFSSFGHLGLGSPDIRGQSSGSAATLAPFILDDLKERPAKILYLTGDKNRDTLPRILNEGGISLQPLQVYETQGSTSFEASLLSKLPSSRGMDNNIWWIVYFAPSAAAFVTAILHKHFDFERSQPPTPPTTTAATATAATASPLRQAKVAAIGPTTSSFLQDDLELRVHAMAQKPTPEDLLSSIIRNDSLET